MDETEPGRKKEERAGRVFSGNVISPGYGGGAVFVYQAGLGPTPPRRHLDASDVAGEQKRLANAIHSARLELEEVRERVLSELGETASHIVAAHLALVSDPAFIAKIERSIEHQRINAESALEEAAAELAKLLANVDNEYLRERSHDIFDVKDRVLKQLGHGAETALEQLPPGTVLVAKELLPSDTLSLDRSHLAALVLERGGPTGHAAILARSMGIPAVGSVQGLFATVRDGASILVDGERGEVVVDPDAIQAARFSNSRVRYERGTSTILVDEQKESVTLDNHRVMLLGNIGRPSEVEQVERHHLAGVGLFRTEYLFMQAPTAPSLDLQRDAYRSVVDQLASRQIVIRTLDLGGDKRPRFPIPRFGRNARLGMRGLRLSLEEDELFRTQIRAILEAARGRNDVAILLPMVVSAEDVARAIAVIDEVACAERGPRPPVGAMLETPSALFEVDDILEQVDFVSLGTNDLVQFMLAVEHRTVETLSEDAIFQPSILRAVHHVATRAAAHDKPLTLCGEAAGDPLAACLLVGLGLRRLSMSPVRAARVRAAIRRHTFAALKDAANRALQAGTRGGVVRIVREALAD